MPVWLAMFGLAFGMQVVCVIGAAVDNQWNADFGTMLFAVVIGLFPLAIGAGSISFASESEEGTDDWLRQLPISAWWLAAIKVLTPMLVCVQYVIVTTLTGAAGARFENGPPDVIASLILGPAMWGKDRQQGW
jgi:ABC-type transport system involved in multi-copper enzyme maturation permease subunit